MTIDDDRVLELSVIDETTNESYSTKIHFEPGAEWDQSILDGLDAKYILTHYEFRLLEESEPLPAISVGEDGLIQPMIVDTIFDIGNFIMSVAEFAIEPTFWNGFWVVADGLSVVFPGIPSVSGVKRMIKDSSILETATKIGVKAYNKLKNDSVPSGWVRHHIFEKRFKPALPNATDNNMLSIPIPNNAEYHQKITNKMRDKYPYGSTDYDSLTQREVIDAHINAYKELYNSTGDEYWEFLHEFTKSRQYRAID